MRQSCALALLAVLLSSGAAVAEEIHRVPYDSAAPGPFLSVEAPNPTGSRDLRAGVAPLNLTQSWSQVDVTILDASQRKTPGRLVFYGPDGAELAASDFCFQTGHAVPTGADEVVVQPSTLVYPCPVQGLTYGPATTGEVQFVLS